MCVCTVPAVLPATGRERHSILFRQQIDQQCLTGLDKFLVIHEFLDDFQSVAGGSLTGAKIIEANAKGGKIKK